MRRPIQILFFIGLIGLASGITAQEQPDDAEQKLNFRWAGEELYFSVRMNGVEAVRAGVRIGDVRYKDGRPYVAVNGTAHSVGVFNSIYPIKDTANSFVSPISLRPFRSEKFFDEKGKKKNYRVDYVHSTYRAKVKKDLVREKGTKTRKFSTPIPGTTHDMMSWFFELRNRKDLKLGQRMTFYIYDGWKLSKLYAHVAAKEDVYTPIGWFKSYRIDFEREVLKTKRKKGNPPVLKVRTPAKPTGSLWVSRDENLIPVKVAVNSKLGRGESVIIKYKLPTAQRKKK